MAPRHERIRPLPDGVDRPAVATYPAGAVLAERVLDVSELVWVIRGSAVVTSDAGPVVLRPGDVLLVPPGVPHAYRWGAPDADDGCVHGYVHLELGAVRQALAVGAGEPLGALCAYLLRLGVVEPPGWRRRVAEVAALAAVLAGEGSLLPEPVPGPPVLEALLAQLRARWGGGPPLAAVTVDELASAVHVTPKHLSRLAGRVWGRPVSTLLEQLRLTRAELLLAGTDATVAAVARQCGFADAFHCSRRFRRVHAVPPGAYRRSAARPTLLDDPVVRAAA
ncbi:MAG TPA: AraC family transcriptional regulator, partial [Kineosporiaceae bacterium]|nr:AraC family transcriptional regulator [Kineosporiaceae bacterium]